MNTTETTSTAVNKVNTDEKTRQMNINAKAQAKADIAKSKPLKNINTGLVIDESEAFNVTKNAIGVKQHNKKSPIIHTPKTSTPEPKVKKVSLASELDKVLQAGGTWEELIAKAEELNKKMGGHIKYSTSVLKAHIKFRTSTQMRKNVDYLTGMEVNDKGIVKSTKKGKK